MKVRVPKSFTQLPQREKEIIAQVKAKELRNEVNQELVWLQKVGLQASCILLNKNGGYGKKRLTLWLAWWREMYRILGTFKSREEMEAYLSAEMDRIFGPNGYPKEYIDKLEDL